MPRRREVPKRQVLPDPKYTSQDVAKFINVLMTRGKKSVAERIIYGALEQIKKKSGKDPLEVFNQAINNVKPMVEVKSRRVGGANYQVPVEVRPVRRVALSMRWLRDAARGRTLFNGKAQCAQCHRVNGQGPRLAPDLSDIGSIRTLAALQRLRRRLIALEPVNPLAATELADIGQRFEFLTTQRADLEKAMADLRSLADDLAATIAEQFSTTLMAVDREFGLFFQRLFNGGQASLRTSDDPEDPGIEIYARPPGKRIGSLAQLSGGERALTATALLLAILRVKPAPFCVLDEVDAALDERNVGRFTQALRELTDRTQFVVITHNRGTIEAADMLYGVSMDDGGVSKVISLKLSELDEQRERAG